MADEHVEQGGAGGSGLNNQTIRVTPETLRQKAGELDTNASEARTLTAQMTELALQLTGRIWSGDAQTAYVSRFRTLQDTIDQYTPLLLRHAANLRTISDHYEATETEATNMSSSLPGNIF